MADNTGRFRLKNSRITCGIHVVRQVALDLFGCVLLSCISYWPLLGPGHILDLSGLIPLSSNSYWPLLGPGHNLDLSGLALLSGTHVAILRLWWGKTWVLSPRKSSFSVPVGLSSNWHYDMPILNNWCCKYLGSFPYQSAHRNVYIFVMYNMFPILRLHCHVIRMQPVRKLLVSHLQHEFLGSISHKEPRSTTTPFMPFQVKYGLPMLQMF